MNHYAGTVVTWHHKTNFHSSGVNKDTNVQESNKEYKVLPIMCLHHVSAMLIILNE